MESFPGFSGGPNAITMVISRGREEVWKETRERQWMKILNWV
jgi:hypothetical protein